MVLAGNVSWLQSMVLGTLQGLTEFLPVSSTAHMALASRLLYGSDVGAAFSAVVQLGPIAAMIWFFRAELARYIRGIFRTGSPGRAITTRDTDARLGWFTLFGSIPLMIFGYVLESKIDREFRTPAVMGVFLIVLAIIMWIAEVAGQRKRTLNQLGFGDSQAIGWAQVLALVPGTSRSGVTITAGLFAGLDRESAARFSFLLSIPAITAAGLYKLLKEARHGGLHGAAGKDLVGAAVACIVAYIVIKWFLGYMKEHSTRVFIFYRIVLGAVLLGLVASGRMANTPPSTPRDSGGAVPGNPAAGVVSAARPVHQAEKSPGWMF